MALITQAVRGTRDVLPTQTYLYRYLEDTALQTARNFGYHELRTPVFEHTELFERGVGDTTDVVQKEMYTFLDKGERSITLRPEGTAGAARACMEHGLLNEALPCKVSYITNCYRYEKPQAGRYREFSQFGVECFGAGTPAADAELIALAVEYFAAIGLENYRVELNSIGCPECRKVYLDKLREYFNAHTCELCATCHGRLEKNPMRILDCKSPTCGALFEQAPITLDHLCISCDAHFVQVQALLGNMNIAFVTNPRMVRGLDYYTHTVIEFVSEAKGLDSNPVLGGGGRYDGLIEQLGGTHTPSCGFAIGLERVLLHLQADETPLPEREECEIYLATRGDDALAVAAKLANDLRAEGIAAQFDIVGRSLKAQMKYADKIGACYTCALGESELETGAVRLKNMQTGSQHAFALADLAEEFAHFLVQQAHEELTAMYEA